jgi:pimeloyl-ACP methyl ester carboxylesterase
MRPEEPVIQELALAANGIRFHALAAGPHDGPLVLLLHGFPELARSWRHQLPALASAGYRAVAPDMRGYGETELHGPYDVATLVRDVTGLIEALGRERAVVVGHDWGGAVAWATAVRAPALVERLVAINCPPASALAHAMRHSREQRKKSRYIFFFQLPWLPERRMAADGAAVVARALVGGSHRKDAWPEEELEAYRAAFARPGRAKAAIDWYRAAFRPSLRRRRPKGSTRRRVSAPTLVLWGARDRFLGRELVSPDALRPVLADGNLPEVVFIEDAGHFVQNEAPERVNEELLRWLGPASR